MSLKYFKKHFDKRNFELREMVKEDLDLKINCGFKRFDEKDFIKKLWSKMNSEEYNYKVYIYKENGKFMGLIAFDYRTKFYFSDYRDKILELIDQSKFNEPQGDMFYLSGILVQKHHQFKNLGNLLMNFIYYFIKVIKEKKKGKFTFYIFTFEKKFASFFKNFEWDKEFAFFSGKENVYILSKEFN